jgi:hypothetical protein
LQFFAIRRGFFNILAIFADETPIVTSRPHRITQPGQEIRMRNTIVTAVAAFALGAITTGVILAQAQPAGPPQDGSGGPPDRMMAHGPGMGRDGGPGMWGHWMHARHAHRMEMMRKFALIYRAEDRKLTPPDVQKIAEAFLLWNGNHTWKVINVKPAGDDIAFDLAAPDGSVIASFTMDPKNAHVSRKG